MRIIHTLGAGQLVLNQEMVVCLLSHMPDDATHVSTFLNPSQAKVVHAKSSLK